MAVQIERKRFTVEEYYRMAEAGILAEDDRVELIEGEIYAMSPLGWLHVNCVNRCNTLFTRELGSAAIVSVQNPILIDDYSSPQPDVTLLRPAEDAFTGRLPGPADVLLLIEVADTSIHHDRGKKLPQYARAGIAEVWIVDLQAEIIRAYSRPENGAYQVYREARRGDLLSPILLTGISARVEEILG